MTAAIPPQLLRFRPSSVLSVAGYVATYCGTAQLYVLTTNERFYRYEKCYDDRRFDSATPDWLDAAGNIRFR